MRITIRGKNLEITPSFREYVDTKLLKPMGKLLAGQGPAGLPTVDLTFSRTTRHHRKGDIFRAETNIILGKKLLRAEASGEDIHTACILLKKEIEREIESWKTKYRSVENRRARTTKRNIRSGATGERTAKGRVWNEGN